MQEDDAEYENAEHHRECSRVVREGGRDEPLVLCVFERPYGHLQTDNHQSIYTAWNIYRDDKRDKRVVEYCSKID